MIHLNSTLMELNKRKPTTTLQSLEKVGIHTIEDLLWIIPLHWHIVPSIKPFHKIIHGQYFKGKGRITHLRHYRSKRRGKGQIPLYNIEADISDEHGKYPNNAPSLTLLWPNAYPPQKKKLENLTMIAFYGIAKEVCRGENHEKSSFQIISPSIAQQEKASNPHVEIQYPTINKVTSLRLKKLFLKIPTHLWESIHDPIETPHLQKIHLCHMREALKIIHGINIPTNQIQYDLYETAKRRLIYHEFYKQQVKIDIRRDLNKKIEAPLIKVSEELKQKAILLLPFTLTDDQNKATEEIIRDLGSPFPMMRMLQGDVGTGKTAVCFIAAILTNLNQYQAALMCPTEALATQHFKKIYPIFKKVGLNCQLLIGTLPHKKKREIIENIALGKVDTVIGTHTLFQDAVIFKNIALSIIDEQHRFGVNQRIRLSNKGMSSHTLIMTATPIPRSLALTQYGELDISTIKTSPFQKRRVQTKVITPSSLKLFLSFLKTRISMGEQAYIVAPSIESTEKRGDLFSVKELFNRFKEIYPEFSLGTLHGKMPPFEKQEVLDSFSNGNTQILISTSIIEVGIDIHNSTVMAIINPECFGLTSLHQMRGRVGRGKSPGFCFLVTERKDNTSIQRLKKLETLTDGFKIAELDLELRKEGDIFGLEQSGNFKSKVSNISTNQDILFQVKKDFPLLKKSLFYAQDYQKFSKELPVPQTI